MVLTGLQAITRVLLDRHRIDAARGLRTGGVVSGYPGSPLGGLDLTLGRARPFLQARTTCVHVPGVNEELAASVVWGTQQSHVVGLARRHRRRLRHLVRQVAGRRPLRRRVQARQHFSVDPQRWRASRSSATTRRRSRRRCRARARRSSTTRRCRCCRPGRVQELLDLGLHAQRAVALQRAVGRDEGRHQRRRRRRRGRRRPPGGCALEHPTIELDGRPWVHRQRLDLGDRHRRPRARHPAGPAPGGRGVRRGQRHQPHRRRTRSARGSASSPAGKTYYDVRQALPTSGFDDDALAAAGIRLLKLGMIYPLERDDVPRVRRRSRADRRRRGEAGVHRSALRNVLYDRAHRPVVVGKRDEDGRRLVPTTGELTGERIRLALAASARRQLRPGLDPCDAAAPHRGAAPIPVRIQPCRAALVARTPAYCSGCPHNRSTVLPEGAVVGGGVGCHGMSYIDPRLDVEPEARRGADGRRGRAVDRARPRSRRRRTSSSNLGDGTFTHSGQLGVRACVAAGVNITFKILYNGYVAMTGGQDVAGGLVGRGDDPRARRRRRRPHHRVCRRPRPLPRRATWRPASTCWHRDDARGARGAADGRRRDRARSTTRCARPRRAGCASAATCRIPQRTVVINELVCEGCGDCSTKSNCLSVQPVDTELGRKTQIHQVVVQPRLQLPRRRLPVVRDVRAGRARQGDGLVGGARRGKPTASAARRSPSRRTRPIVGADPYRIYMIGIGGTGVVTANQCSPRRRCSTGCTRTGLDQTGMSQKAGAVASHLKVSTEAARRPHGAGGRRRGRSLPRVRHARRRRPAAPRSRRAGAHGDGGVDDGGADGVDRRPTRAGLSRRPTRWSAHIAASSRPDAFVAIDAQAPPRPSSATTWSRTPC